MWGKGIGKTILFARRGAEFAEEEMLRICVCMFGYICKE
jgi:hypothetical protein